MSRPIDIDALIDRTIGSPVAQERVRQILRTFTEQQQFQEAAEALSVSTQRLHELRDEILQGAVAAAEPKPLGRPAAPPADPKDERIRQLEQERHDLKVRHHIACLREEMLALGMGRKLKGLEKKRRSSSAQIRRELADRQRQRERQPAATTPV